MQVRPFLFGLNGRGDGCRRRGTNFLKCTLVFHVQPLVPTGRETGGRNHHIEGAFRPILIRHAGAREAAMLWRSMTRPLLISRTRPTSMTGMRRAVKGRHTGRPSPYRVSSPSASRASAAAIRSASRAGSADLRMPNSSTGVPRKIARHDWCRAQADVTNAAAAVALPSSQRLLQAALFRAASVFLIPPPGRAAFMPSCAQCWHARRSGVVGSG